MTYSALALSARLPPIIMGVWILCSFVCSPLREDPDSIAGRSYCELAWLQRLSFSNPGKTNAEEKVWKCFALLFISVETIIALSSTNLHHKSSSILSPESMLDLEKATDLYLSVATLGLRTRRRVRQIIEVLESIKDEKGEGIAAPCNDAIDLCRGIMGQGISEFLTILQCDICSALGEDGFNEIHRAVIREY